MLVTAFEGVVEKGKVSLCEEISLPEHTRVYVIVADNQTGPSVHVRTPRLAHAQQARDFRKKIVEIPADARL